ncbi:hypothetical protein HMPREF9075_02530 [Capnocytophaga sp. oral taxon 332 str. F0381]|uniref:hypothetical protein n=1 Tax=Capnocytophaga sp. oral taxon 332 TaxID=712213 RepID=UPI0002A4692D|nr:hypothetical protein [Capnocytophaga sp. oral taxon 332]EKY05949.1 hypothetical protein HMPREF9075_02530 [Capnocytophaga sp. oral taxon 332 str. F0381]
MLSKYLENIKPSTFAIVLVALLIGDALYEYVVFAPTTHDMYRVGRLLLSFVLLFFTLLLLHQIDRWNELTETKNSYSIAFFSIFVVLFPSVFAEPNLIGANLLIVIALWRVLTLKTGEGIAQKLFDTSLLIVCASLLHYWALLFLLNVWISLLFYGAQKRRYWFIPLLAIVVVAILAGSVMLVVNSYYPIIPFLYTSVTEYKWTYLEIFHNYSIPYLVALVCLVVLLLISLIIYYFKRSYHTISSLIVIQFLWVSIGVAVLSGEVLYSFAPIAVLFALYIEKIRVWWLKETLLWLMLLLPAVFLFLHFITKS